MNHVMSERARSSLERFLDLPCGEARTVYPRALEWALDPDYGGLPSYSAQPFAAWLDNVWENWTEEPEVTVRQIFEGAVEDWCGGRVMPS